MLQPCRALPSPARVLEDGGELQDGNPRSSTSSTLERLKMNSVTSRAKCAAPSAPHPTAFNVE